MKIANIMNFVRYIDERWEGSVDGLYSVTASQLEMLNEFGLENTFLLQYDALVDSRYQKLFKEQATEKTELGLWYEIVEPLTTACGLPYNSENGWKWDWHIIPGFSMAYAPEEREKLADEAMRKFKEIFGYYPKTIGCWVIDTYTINYLAEHYNISAFAICRDQYEIDAYTLVGGYFNQAYYPSKNNMFTPAQTEEMQVNVPLFRLLGPCPIHNYEGRKYLSEGLNDCIPISTLEPTSILGENEQAVDWFYETYYKNEDLGFSYAQLGQENSMGFRLMAPLRMQIEKIQQLNDVTIQKMCDTGEMFKKTYKHTPATSVVALSNWDTEDIQSAYYDCCNYTANVMRFEDRVFIRSLYLFDENVKDNYLEDTCASFYAMYENLPIIDTLRCSKNEKYDCGLMIDTDATEFHAIKTDDGVLKICWDDKSVIFSETKITIFSDKLRFYVGEAIFDLKVLENTLVYQYKGTQYRLRVEHAELTMLDNGDIEIVPCDKFCELYPEACE